MDHAVLVNQLKVCIIYFNPDTVTTTFDSKFLYLFIFGIALVGGIVSFFNIRFDKSCRLDRVSWSKNKMPPTVLETDEADMFLAQR